MVAHMRWGVTHRAGAVSLRRPWRLATRSARAAAARAGAKLVPILTVPGAAALDRITRAAEGPGLRVTVDKIFPFEALAAAFDHLQSGKAKGRIVLARG